MLNLALSTCNGDLSILNNYVTRRKFSIEDVEKARKRLQSIQSDIDKWEILDLLDELKYRYSLLDEEAQIEVRNSANDIFK